ncbi:YbaK/EbsC family protein [Halobaculum sp. MBLA0147]|uniref:YbaK/EbsC family protein n=1 Tax=Halobaculum sp. MBLA0147 TaxID=3079934 RepID=UPI0035256FD0
MHETTREFVERLRAAHGVEPAVETFPEGTKTAADAAAAVGCEPSQIVKSVVLTVDLAGGDDGDGDTDGASGTHPNPTDSTDEDGRAVVVVLTAGHHRVDTDALVHELGAESVSLADPDTVQAATGWSIGGVPPVCHDRDLPVYLDESLRDHETVWAAAGTPETVFPVAPERLVAWTDPTPTTAFEDA